MSAVKLYAKKSLGQNFLINPRIVEKIVEAAAVSAEDTVLEVGPGTGNLTRALAATGARVIAVEKDRRVIEDLQAEFSAAQIEIIEGDILEFDPAANGLQDGGYKIVANLPYYITSHFLRTVFEKWPRPSLMILMVQKEVARRITAKPPRMNLLALSVQYYADPKIIAPVRAGNFRPMPNVDSAIISLRPKAERLKPAEEEMLFKLLRAGFSGKRKQLVNNLAKNFGMMKDDLPKLFAETGLKPDIRAENLSLSQWMELSKHIKK